LRDIIRPTATNRIQFGDSSCQVSWLVDFATIFVNTLYAVTANPSDQSLASTEKYAAGHILSALQNKYRLFLLDWHESCINQITNG